MAAPAPSAAKEAPPPKPLPPDKPLQSRTISASSLLMGVDPISDLTQSTAEVFSPVVFAAPPDNPCAVNLLIQSSSAIEADLGQPSKASSPASEAAVDFSQTIKSSSPVTNQPPASIVQPSSAAILEMLSHTNRPAKLLRSMSAPSLARAVTKSSGTDANPTPVDSTVMGYSRPSFVDVAKNNITKKMPPLFGQPPALPGASLTSKDGFDIIMFDDDSTRLLSEPFKWALVGKFSHGVPDTNNLGKFFLNLNLEGDFELRWVNNRQVLVVFSLECDYTRVWLQGLWHIAGCPMRLLKWTPHYNAKIESAIVPVWVKLPGLPVHLYDKRALFHIASQLGKPIMADDPTASQTRLSFARFCVEIDLLEHLKYNIVIGINGKIIDQPVVYENVPKYCSFCNHIGHDVSQCYIKSVELKPPPKSKDKAKAPDSAQQQLVKGLLVDKEKQKQGKENVDKNKLQQPANKGQQGGLSDKEKKGKSKVQSDSRVSEFLSTNPFQSLENEDGDVHEILEIGKVKVGQGRGQKMKDQQSVSKGEGKVKLPLVHAQVQAATPSANSGQPCLELQTQCGSVPPESSIPVCPDRRLVQAAAQSAMFNPQQLVTHEFFIPAMEVAQVSYHQALDMVAEREYVCSDDDYVGSYYDSDDDLKEQALHRGCSTPDFKRRNKRGAFSSGYGGRITRSMAKFC